LQAAARTGGADAARDDGQWAVRRHADGSGRLRRRPPCGNPTIYEQRTIMKSLKLIVIAVIAAAVASPAFAGRDETWNTALERAATRASDQKGLAGPVGFQGRLGPSTSRATINLGHPTERVRR
jgi:hypothetical protein